MKMILEVPVKLCQDQLSGLVLLTYLAPPSQDHLLRKIASAQILNVSRLKYSRKKLFKKVLNALYAKHALDGSL